MKIAQYQEIYKLSKVEDLQPLEKAAHLYGIMKGKDYDWVCENIQTKELIKYYSKNLEITPMKSVPMFYFMNWRLWRLKLNILENTTNDNAMVMAYAANQDAMIENLHLIMATLTIRKSKSVKIFNKLANQIKHKVDIKIAYSLLLFFLKEYNQERILKQLTMRMEIVNSQLHKILQEDTMK